MFYPYSSVGNTFTYPGCPAQAVNGMFYSLAANRRQPNLFIIEGGGGGVEPKPKLGWLSPVGVRVLAVPNRTLAL